MSHIGSAFALFGFTLHDDISVAFRFGMRIPIENLTLQQLRIPLQHLARRVCYVRGCEKKRKDTHTPKGIIDFDLTATMWKKTKLTFADGLPPKTLFESYVVGCTLTRDRLFAAQLEQTSACRFCHKGQETLPHLLECEGVLQLLGHPISHELGEHFFSLGIVEHPPKIAEHRLRMSLVSNLQLADLNQPNQETHYWTPSALVNIQRPSSKSEIG